MMRHALPFLPCAESVDAESGWNPRGFADFRQFYPATPSIVSGDPADASAEFIATFEASRSGNRQWGDDITFVFVRGLFGRWIPGHLAGPVRSLRESGASVLIARTHAAGTIETNARLIRTDVNRRVPDDQRLIFLCHSKGGLDLLAALRDSPGLRRRTAAVVLCQTPRGGCAVMERMLLRQHLECPVTRLQKASEHLAAGVIAAIGARSGCLEVTDERIVRVIPELDAIAATLPMLAVVSWSSRPSAWLDSQHGRLEAIRPLCAHDGLFWLENLVWPVGERVLLPHIDHSQPCVGGLRFPHERFWSALAGMALARAN